LPKRISGHPAYMSNVRKGTWLGGGAPDSYKRGEATTKVKKHVKREKGAIGGTSPRPNTLGNLRATSLIGPNQLRDWANNKILYLPQQKE